ncbi:hypothetical protein RF55_11115 [Lasius niger]|uniref:Mutator-like transposase domain-containing protein n=1 Tax=Lasius niger TaxID=67767 RepID=A0A0J7N9C3_LASNI|nr:hypothetical protein RF55_11115 [Lasius niger]
MSTLEELLSLQDQLINSVAHTLPNFKKLGLAKMTLATTRQRLKTLNDTFQKAQEQESKINLLADDKIRASQAYFKDESFLACEDYYNEAADFMAEILATYEPTDHNSSGTVNRLSDSFQSSSSHLPTIDLPTFDGSFDKWESFRDKFKSMIHDDPQLSDIKRLHYLCSCLKGDASNALHDINLTETMQCLESTSNTGTCYVDKCEDNNFVIDNSPLDPNRIQECMLEGRRIVDISFMWNEIHRVFDNHMKGIECQFKDWKLVGSRKHGLLAKLFFKCQMCNHEARIWSEPIEPKKLDVNKAAVLTTVTAGIGYAQLEEICAGLNIPCMSERTYIENRENIVDDFQKPWKA